jgi:hypothetical protein
MEILVARFVLLEFPDDTEAEDFVGVVLSGKPGSSWKVMKVWGIFQKPTKFCECIAGKKTASGFTRGVKYGWWVCARCKKPTAKWASGRQWFTVIGTNLLPRSLRPYPEEMPPSLESPAVLNELLTFVESPERTP